MSKGVLVLSGYNIRAVVCFCRWATESNVPFHLIARNEFDSIFHTTFRHNVILVREGEVLELEVVCSWIRLLQNKYNYEEVLILPSTEYFNRFLLHNRRAIELVGGIIPLVSKELYDRISDKYSFGKTCRDFGIPVPSEYNAIPDSFPFVAKPRSYSLIHTEQLKPYLIHNEDDLVDFCQNEFAEEYYFQDYIKGKSIYLLASIPKYGKPIIYAQENLMQQANGGSIIIAKLDTFHKERACDQYLALLKELGFYGLIMIEVRLHPETQKYFMIEANPRLWGPIQLGLDNGFDVFGSFLHDYGFEVSDSSSKNNLAKFYFWSGGLVSHRKPVFHNYSAELFVDDFTSLVRSDLFLRSDTINLFHHELCQSYERSHELTLSQLSLVTLFNIESKHSNYQSLARPLRSVLWQDRFDTFSRHEVERIEYILTRYPIKDKVVADVGGNTGFFALECGMQGASKVLYFEGNKAHCEFVRRAVNILHLEEVTTLIERYVNFRDDFNYQVDLCFLLNVLHHIGDDYDESIATCDDARRRILDSLSFMSQRAKILVFQLGFNWKGDSNLPFFLNGTKAELIDFVRRGTLSDWEIVNIGIAQRVCNNIEYQNLDEINIERDDELGEFLNRPLFIMRSLKFLPNS